MTRKQIICLGCAGLVFMAHPAPSHAQIETHTLGSGRATARSDDDAEQRVPNRNFRSGDMLPIDDGMFKTSAMTGGVYYMWAPGEFASDAERVSPFLTAYIATVGRTVFHEYGELALDAPEKRFFDVTVDEGTRSIAIFIGLQSREEIIIEQPNGKRLTPETNDFNNQVFDTTYMRLAVIKDPLPGTWVIVLNGRGKFLISVKK